MNKKILLVAALFLIFFYFFSHEVKRGFLKQTDFNFTVVLQNHMPKRLDSLWEVIALPVTPTPSVFVVGLLTIAAFVDIKNKKIRLRALIIPILFGLLVMGELYGKFVVHHPSPPFFMIKNPTTIFPQFYVNEQYSYPSGHTARAVFLSFAIYSIFINHKSLFVSKKRKLLLAFGLSLYAIMVAIGRVYLGHHWVSDVVGGALLGSGLGTILILVL